MEIAGAVFLGVKIAGTVFVGVGIAGAVFFRDENCGNSLNRDGNCGSSLVLSKLLFIIDHTSSAFSYGLQLIDSNDLPSGR